MKIPVAICLICFSYFVVAPSSNRRTSGFPELTDSVEIAVDIFYEIVPRQKSSFWSFTRSRRDSIPEMKLTVNLPQTIKGKQKIKKLAFEPSPSKVFIENGNKYAEYVFPIPKEKTRIKIYIEAKAFRYDLTTAMKKINQSILPDSELKPFLRHERMIEKKNPVIKKMSKAIQGQNELDTVKNIYRYVIRNLTIDPSKLKGVGAAKTARSKKGMCIDYCDLFVALCRAKDFPARVIAGYRTHYNVSPKHSWVEVYFKEYGWVPFDVSVNKNQSEEFLNWRFYNLPAQYLYFTSLRNDPVLYNNYYYCYPYWDKKFNKSISHVNEVIEFKKPLHKSHDSREDYERARKAGHIK